MFLDYKQGGLKIMNFPALVKSQRVMWVKKLLNQKENMKWKQYFNFVTKDIGGEFIFSCDYLSVLLKVKAPQFYTDLLEVWVDTRHIRSVKSNILYTGNVILFNKKFLRFKGKCKYDENMPLAWKRNIREEENNISETDFSLGGEVINISNLRSKQIYLQLLKKKESEPPVFDRI